MTPLWTWVVVASLAAWATKVAGLAVPVAWTRVPRLRRTTVAVPVAVLSGLAAVALVDGGGAWRLDPALLAGTAAGATMVVTERGGVLGALVVGAAATAATRALLG